MTLDELTRAALALSDDDRSAMAERLWDSLPEAGWSTDEANYDPEYVAELERRLESVRNGTADLISVEEAMRIIMSDGDDAG